MPSAIALSRQQVKSYHQHRHLLVQFIVSELLLAHQELSKVSQLFQEGRSEYSADQLEPLRVHMTKLSGSTRGDMRLFSWHGDGILAKLKNYCAFLTHKESSKEHAKLYQEANNGWLASLQILDMLQVLTEQVHSPARWDSTLLKQQLDKLNRSIVRLARSIAKLLPSFRHDENVLFFLIRRKDSIDNLYGIGFTRKVLRKMFPKGKGLIEADRFITKKYADRGFIHLVPLIQNKIAKMMIKANAL